MVSRGLTVLVVDDERATREGIVRGLAWGALGVREVREAADGLAALRVAREWRPDILVSDVRMPRMDGIELAATIRRSYPSTQIVFLSGYADKEYLKSAVRLGAIDYVEKPLNLEEMAAAVARAAAAAARIRGPAADGADASPARSDSYQAIERAARALADPSAPVAEAVEAVAGGLLPLRPSGRLVTLACRVDRTGPLPGSALVRSEVQRSIAALFPESDGGCLYAVSPDEVLLHVSWRRERSIGDLAGSAERLRAALIRVAGTERVAVGVGRFVSELNELHESAASARAALASVFALGYGVHLYRARATAAAAIDDAAVTAALVERISGGDAEGVEAALRDFASGLRERCGSDPDAGRHACMRVALEIERLANRRATASSGRSDLLWKVVSASPTADDAVGHMRDSALALARDNESTIRQGHAVAAALRAIEARFREDFGVAELAREVGISANYLSTMFKRATGRTISETVTERRVREARDLLLQRRLLVADVAARVGYRDEKYFTRVFRKLTGMSPAAWRRTHA